VGTWKKKRERGGVTHKNPNILSKKVFRPVAGLSGKKNERGAGDHGEKKPNNITVREGKRGEKVCDDIRIRGETHTPGIVWLCSRYPL